MTWQRGPLHVHSTVWGSFKLWVWGEQTQTNQISQIYWETFGQIRSLAWRNENEKFSSVTNIATFVPGHLSYCALFVLKYKSWFLFWNTWGFSTYYTFWSFNLNFRPISKSKTVRHTLFCNNSNDGVKMSMDSKISISNKKVKLEDF